MKRRLIIFLAAFALIAVFGRRATVQAQQVTAQNGVLDLNGRNGWAELPPETFNGLSEATVEAWVKWRDFGAEPAPQFFNEGRGNPEIFSLGSDHQKIGIEVFIGGGTGGLNYFIEDRPYTPRGLWIDGIFRTNEWFHVAAVSGNAGMRLYFNGVLVASNSFSGSLSTITNRARLRLGKSVAENEPVFNGQLDEVRVWNTARTAQQISESQFRRLTGREEGLVALWNFNDGTADDTTGGSHHGKLVGQAHVEGAELPPPERAPRPALVYGAYPTWRENPWIAQPGLCKALVRVEQDGQHVRTIATNIRSESQYKFLIWDPAQEFTLRAFDAWGRYWEQRVHLQPGETFRFDLLAGNTVAVRRPLPQNWLADALREPDYWPRDSAAAWVTYRLKEPLERPLAEALIHAADKGHVPNYPAVALQYASLPAPLGGLFIGWHRAAGWLLIAMMAPFVLLHLLIFAFRRESSASLYYAVWVSLATAFSWLWIARFTLDPNWVALAFLLLTAQALAGLRLLYALFYPRPPKRYWFFAIWFAVQAVALGLFPAGRLWAGSSPFNGGHPEALALIFALWFAEGLETLRVIALAIWRRKEGAWLVGGGFLVLLAGGLIENLGMFGLVNVTDSLNQSGIGTSLITPTTYAVLAALTAVHLARNFALTNRRLELATEEANRARQTAEAAKSAADHANLSKSQFLANMSHELRTPLNAIIGYSEMMQEEVEDLGAADLKPDLQKVVAAARHQLGLVNDILDLSKIEAGKMTLALSNFDISPLVHEVASTVQPLVSRNRNSMAVDCAASIGKMTADQTKVRQTLLNLLSNASKFTENGTISLRVERSDSIIRFTVTDSGLGMTPEQLSRLFQAFTQAETVTAAKYGGTGLGLALSRNFCRLMGGDITVTSEYGKGSTFTVTLPAEVAP